MVELRKPLAYAGVLASIVRDRQWGPEQRRLVEARCEALLCRESDLG